MKFLLVIAVISTLTVVQCQYPQSWYAQYSTNFTNNGGPDK